ncbi:hypothetical protein [Allobaculum sp. Allo2]|uniref:hypothetical protein n=1 Tax=Allobaculum sp. Allo2 TaxID=2853432 RepID=UPI001F608FA1|nr:hypothetical protein [Allobaculum sp. Allo2]UNT94038.1 hypothetical protein KWG61_05145 [Allobaculum sp. Allo2]
MKRIPDEHAEKDAEDPQGIYEMFYDFTNPIKTIPHHRVLAMDRAEKEKVITVSITSDNEDIERRIRQILLAASRSATG